MVAAAFFTVALIHLLVWSRMRTGATDICAALTSAAAGANAVAEQAIYSAVDLDAMAWALKWYVATSGIWIIALVWFVVAYTGVRKVGRSLAVGISAIFGGALIVNFYSKSSFLYANLDGLREVIMPWGDTIRLAEGRNSPWRFVTEVALLGTFGLVIAGWFSLKQQRRPQAWLFTGGMIVFLLFYEAHAFLVDTGRLSSPYLSSYAFLAVLLVMSYDLSGGVVRAAELSVRLQQKESELRTAVADERHRIAGDLHDSVTQTLFSTAAIAEALPAVWDRHPEEARRGLVELRELTKGALAEMRSLLVELRPAALLEKSLADLLRELGDAVAGRSKIPVHVEVHENGEPPDDVKVACYRVAQESLNNIARHAHATSATLRLQEDGGSIILSIVDDGCGFKPTAGNAKCLGLKIMRDRVQAIGGVLQIESTVGQGTSVTVCWQKSPRGGPDG